MKNKKRTMDDIKYDSIFKKNTSAELNQMLDEEMKKPDDEIDWEAVEEIMDALLFLNNMENNEFTFKPILIKKFRTRYVLGKMLVSVSSIAAAIALVVVCSAIVVHQQPAKIISDTTSKSTAFVATVQESTQATQNDAHSTAADNTSQATNKAQERTTLPSTKPHQIAKPTSDATTMATTKHKEKPTADNKSTTSRTKPIQSTTVPHKQDKPVNEPTSDNPTQVIESNKKLLSITGQFVSGFKKYYKLGESFDTYGIVIIAKYDDGSTTQISVDECAFSGFSSNTTGKKTIYVTYEGKAFSYDIIVIN